jgi:hypothetical protein
VANKKRGKRYEHHKVWEGHYGPVPIGYVVHHKDEDHGNNDIDNLQLMLHAEHTKHHQQGKPKTEAHKAKLSEAHIGKGHPRGEVSPETRAKLSAAAKGKVLSDETKAKMSAFQKGRVKTPEHLAKLSAALSGRTLPDETKAKMSDAMKGNTFNRGRTHTEESRANMSAAHKGQTCPEEKRTKLSAALKAYWANRKAKQEDVNGKI